jgi:hypothetical protein
MEYMTQYRPTTDSNGEINTRKGAGCGGLPHFITDKLWQLYNWNGTQGKLAMGELFFFKRVLYGEL